MNFALLKLKDLRIVKYATKDELENAIQDFGIENVVALRYHAGADLWVVLEEWA